MCGELTLIPSDTLHFWGWLTLYVFAKTRANCSGSWLRIFDLSFPLIF